MQTLERHSDRPRRLLRWVVLYFGSTVIAPAITQNGHPKVIAEKEPVAV
jgi:hypothetical protein